MKRLTRITMAALGMSALSTMVFADELVVVELFTSQGCVSCPPADELLGQLSHREDVIALALHVDYWDYIGWADTFAEPDFTARQHAYGRMAGSTVVYTPQMIVGGVDHVVGYRPMELADLIVEHRSRPHPVAIEATGSGRQWRVEAEWQGDGDAPAMVIQLVAYSPMQEVEITRGENAGISAAYYNIVRSWQVVSNWSGDTHFEADVTTDVDLPYAVIVQAAGPGAILGAARLN